MSKKMEGVREYASNSDMFTCEVDGRLVVEAHTVPSPVGSKHVHIDLVDLIDWAKRERPDLMGTQIESTIGVPGDERRETLDALRLWAAHRYEAEVENRPRENMHRPALERVWGEVRAKFDAMAESPAPHVERFTDGELLRYCGADASRWAAAFCQIAAELGVVKLETLGHKPIDEGWMIGWFANAIMTAHDTYRRTAPRLSASEAVYGVLGALTARKDPRTFSAEHDASWAAEFAAAFVAVNDLDEPRDHWPQNLTHPPEDLAAMPVARATGDQRHARSRASWVFDSRDEVAALSAWADRVEVDLEASLDERRAVQAVRVLFGQTPPIASAPSGDTFKP